MFPVSKNSPLHRTPSQRVQVQLGLFAKLDAGGRMRVL